MNTMQQARTSGVNGKTSDQPINWWKFKITDEQARAWQNGDINAAKQFFEENEKLLVNIAKHFLSKTVAYRLPSFFAASIQLIRRFYCLDDLIDQIYADLPYYGFFDGKTLYNRISQSCIYVAFGGIRARGREIGYEYSLDSPITDNLTLADVIADKLTVDDYVEVNPAMAKAFESVLDQVSNIIYPNSKDELKRLAFIRRF